MDSMVPYGMHMTYDESRLQLWLLVMAAAICFNLWLACLFRKLWLWDAHFLLFFTWRMECFILSSKSASRSGLNTTRSWHRAWTRLRLHERETFNQTVTSAAASLYWDLVGIDWPYTFEWEQRKEAILGFKFSWTQLPLSGEQLHR